MPKLLKSKVMWWSRDKDNADTYNLGSRKPRRIVGGDVSSETADKIIFDNQISSLAMLRLKPGKEKKFRLVEAKRGKIKIEFEADGFYGYKCRIIKERFCISEFQRISGLRFSGTKYFRFVVVK